MSESPELRPAEHMALTMAKNVARRGEDAGPNTVLMLCLTIERLAGMGDYLIDEEASDA